MVFLCQVFICDYLCVLRPFLFLFHVLFIDAGRPTNTGIMLVQHCKQTANIESTLGKQFVFAVAVIMRTNLLVLQCQLLFLLL